MSMSRWSLQRKRREGVSYPLVLRPIGRLRPYGRRHGSRGVGRCVRLPSVRANVCGGMASGEVAGNRLHVGKGMRSGGRRRRGIAQRRRAGTAADGSVGSPRAGGQVRGDGWSVRRLIPALRNVERDSPVVVLRKLPRRHRGVVDRAKVLLPGGIDRLVRLVE